MVLFISYNQDAYVKDTYAETNKTTYNGTFLTIYATCTKFMKILRLKGNLKDIMNGVDHGFGV